MSDERKREETQAYKDLRSRYSLPMLRDNPDARIEYKLRMPADREISKKMRKDRRA